MKKIILLLTLITTPHLSYAESTLQDFLGSASAYFGGPFIGFLLGIAFLFFVINAIRYFVLGGASEDGRKSAKALMIYSISAFVLIITFFGIVNLFSSSLDFTQPSGVIPDYIEKN